jgi:hypothetical protein
LTVLSEDRLTCLEAGIYEFSALSLGGEGLDEEFEDLSPKAKVVVLDMLSTIRELQARVAELEEALWAVDPGLAEKPGAEPKEET